jgi:succinoglycan biosynthesis protein ExoO
METNLPHVSIIIPTYNVGTYIQRSIHSALSQVGINLEIIMIDDCSTDDTVELAQAIQDPRLKIITLPQNSGPGFARNTGFSVASGDWIAVLDGDDVLETERILTCVNTGLCAQADIVVDNLTVFRERDGVHFPMFSRTQLPEHHQIKLAQFIKGNQNFLSGYSLGYLKPIFRRDFLNNHKLRYATDIKIGEDYIFMAEALAAGAKCVISSGAGYHYTARIGSTSHRLTLADVLRIKESDARFLQKYPLTRDEKSAQKKRNQQLDIAYAFTNLVDSIKSRNIKSVLKIVAAHPSTPLYLWDAIRSRILKFFN